MCNYVEAIRESGLSIYDPIEVGDPDLWIPSRELEEILNAKLVGMDVNYPNRTRSKKVKERVADALGYPVPNSFSRTQPRFPGQNFDVYVQKSNNLQIWNEEVEPTRRYVIADVNASKTIRRVKVVNGDTLAELDKSGTLTSKYQAQLIPGATKVDLISPRDTVRMEQVLSKPAQVDLSWTDPTQYPRPGELLPIKEINDRLAPLVGNQFDDPGLDQERNRGSKLHRKVCQALGYPRYADDGTFPDVTHQVLEVKLQTSPTIDLGIALPSDVGPIDFPMINGVQLRHCDVRYALFYGSTDGLQVEITHLFVTTGKDFFDRFTQFGGNTINKKRQISLPDDFFA